jgi:hypothetical protein
MEKLSSTKQTAENLHPFPTISAVCRPAEQTPQKRC